MITNSKRINLSILLVTLFIMLSVVPVTAQEGATTDAPQTTASTDAADTVEATDTAEVTEPAAPVLPTIDPRSAEYRAIAPPRDTLRFGREPDRPVDPTIEHTAAERRRRAQLSAVELMVYEGLPDEVGPLTQFGYRFFDSPAMREAMRETTREAPTDVTRDAPADTREERTQPATRTPSELRMRPVRNIGPDYILGPGDVLQLFLWGTPVDSGDVSSIHQLRVQSGGTIFFAPTGPLAVTGRTVAEVQDLIRTQLERRYRQVGISLTVEALREFPVYVAGFVESPGTVSATAVDTLFQVLARTGGIEKTGSLRNITVTRRSGERRTIDLYELLLEGRDVDLHMQEGDSILVPPIGPVSAVYGQVRRPGIYELRGTQNVEQLLEMSGGTLPSAFLADASITQYSREERLRIDGNLNRPAFTSRRLDNGDILRVGRLREDERNRLVAAGAFKFPGTYSQERFATMGALLEEAQVLNETNLNYGRVYRTLPGGTRADFTFSPRRVMSGENHVPLRAGDEVRLYLQEWVPSTLDIDRFPETIAVQGEIRRPQLFAWYDGMTLRSVLTEQMLLTNTSRVYAELLRTTAQGDQEIEIFSPQEVLRGDVDITLRPRDVVALSERFFYEPIRASGDAIQRGTVVPYHDGITLIDLVSNLALEYDIKQIRADITDRDGRRQAIYLEDEFGEDRLRQVRLRPGDEVRLTRLQPEERRKNVVVRGQVRQARSISFDTDEPIRLSEALERVGGYTDRAFPRAMLVLRESVAASVEAQIERHMAVLESSITQLEAAAAGGTDPQTLNIQLQAAAQRAQLANLRATYGSVLGRISLEIPDTLEALRGSSSDIILEAGDQIIVPSEPDFVSVLGEVTNSITINYTEGMRVRDLLDQAGWAMQNADIPAAYIVRASGRIVSAGNRPSFLFFNRTILNDRLEPGDLVYIPREPQRVPVAIPIIRDVTQIIGNLLSTSISAVTLLVTVGAI